MRYLGFLLAAMAVITSSACTRKVVVAPYAPAMAYPGAQRITASPSSLWAEGGPSSWIADDKAHSVGDIVTVEVITDTSAQESATTATDRDAAVKAEISNLFGFADVWPRDGEETEGSLPPIIEANSSANFDGTANTNRSGKITARLSAVVTDVYPNGNMHIQGSQAVMINNEQSVLMVEGIIRPSDVSIDNTVLSTQIANARIEYTGRGVVSDLQRPGLGTRLFNRFWMF